MIGRELGRGGSGRVYVAEDAMLARPVAIKFIADLDAGARQRFLIEARVVAQIHHPNVVAIYRVGTLNNRPYLVTELVRGVSLAELAKPLTWSATLDIAIGVARGLAAVHRGNVVHCDLKPSNVMIDRDGVAKIIDFGLARPNADGSAARAAPVGTPDYMAPEVWRGEVPGRRADVYSLGAVLFELIAGAPPFAATQPAALREKVTTGEAPPLREVAPEVDPAFAAVIARCLRREREARFADGEELRQALERLRASSRHAVRPGENPYRGLLPFEATHRGLFFGRRSEVDAVVERLRGEPIVLVTGDSGVGKSSLCRAGVLPAVVDGVLGGAWQALTLVPGQRPLTALAGALGDASLVSTLRDNPALLARELRRRADDHGLIVFIDQLEELITLGDPVEVAALDAGLAELLDGVAGVRVLASVRADFLARLSTLPGLGRDLPRLLYFLRPLAPERLRDVIAGPAEAVGVRFEPAEIVDELIEATAQAGSGGLPLLSFALADLWEARDRSSDVIPRSAVAAMGGVAGALSRHANVVLGSMIVDERVQARRLLLRLVSPMGTRARRTAQDLALGELARSALEALVQGRLVVVHDGEAAPEYELAHECLITGWSTLRQWLATDVAGRATRLRLATASNEWVRLGRPSDATWQGPRLGEATALDPASLSDDERAFVAASLRANRVRRWQRWLAVIGALGLIALAFWSQRYLARRELAFAVADEVAHARRLLADAEHADTTRAALATRAFLAFDAIRWDDGEALWDQAMAQREAAERAYRNASSHAERAFAKDPMRADIRDLMGDITFDRAALADEVHDPDERDEQLERLRLYDADGSRIARWEASGRVIVHAPADGTIVLEPGRTLGQGGADVRLRPGSYVITMATPGHDPVRAPIVVGRGGQLVVDLARPPAIPPGFVYIPAGEFLYGYATESDRPFFSTTPLRRRTTAAYLIGRDEVTIADWLSYVEAMPPAQRVLPTLSPERTGAAITPDGAGHWKLELVIDTRHYKAGWGEPIRYVGRATHAEQDWRRFPIMGVSALDAVAYAAWLDRTGRVPGARLCSEVEWERAGRGADDRGYPGGRRLERGAANIDETHGRELMGPDEIGSHPGSRSPFGLDDMTGNVYEWAKSEQADYILRSGDYAHDPKSDHLTNRSPMASTVRYGAAGIRLCATPALPR